MGSFNWRMRRKMWLEMNVFRHKTMVFTSELWVNGGGLFKWARPEVDNHDRTGLWNPGDWERWRKALGSYPVEGWLPWSPSILQVNHYLNCQRVNWTQLQGLSPRIVCVSLSMWSITAPTLSACFFRKGWINWMFLSSSWSLPFPPPPVFQGI